MQKKHKQRRKQNIVPTIYSKQKIKTTINLSIFNTERRIIY